MNALGLNAEQLMDGSIIRKVTKTALPLALFMNLTPRDQESLTDKVVEDLCNAATTIFTRTMQTYAEEVTQIEAQQPKRSRRAKGPYAKRIDGEGPHRQYVEQGEDYQRDDSPDFEKCES